jgi:hypothetical protein
MIWAVKILALNKKDGKGNDLNFPTKKSLPTKTRRNTKNWAFQSSKFIYLNSNSSIEVA